jgi:hypothetical protein
VQGYLKLLLAFLGKKTTLILRLKEAGLRARHAAVKKVLTDEPKLYRLAFAESNVDRKWDRVTFSDEYIFSSANDGHVLVYRPRGERHGSQYMSTCTRSGRVSVHCWGWISHEGSGMFHRVEGHLYSLQYQHNLQNVMLPSVRMLYPEGILHFQ